MFEVFLVSFVFLRKCYVCSSYFTSNRVLIVALLFRQGLLVNRSGEKSDQRMSLKSRHQGTKQKHTKRAGLLPSNSVNGNKGCTDG